ncbi:MAG TPA: hypothetical protein VHK91_00320 [Flavisolibacter sp.]|jgi:hypothetical protein|nr:hypothetical protein [Flavisolibacter sp.]
MRYLFFLVFLFWGILASSQKLSATTAPLFVQKELQFLKDSVALTLTQEPDATSLLSTYYKGRLAVSGDTSVSFRKDRMEDLEVFKLKQLKFLLTNQQWVRYLDLMDNRKQLVNEKKKQVRIKDKETD